MKTFGKYSIGNVYKRLKKSAKSIDLANSGIDSVKNKLSKYDYLQKKQYELLPDSVQHMFETVNLYPGLLDCYTPYTFRNIVFHNPGYNASKSAINRMNKDIKNTKNLCVQNNPKLVFVNMPVALFTGHKVLRTPNDDLFKDFFEENNRVDSIYQSIAIQSKLSCIKLTAHFIALFPKDNYYYKFDGQPNENECAEIAEYMETELLKQKIIN
jgi:hypothetical protein